MKRWLIACLVALSLANVAPVAPVLASDEGAIFVWYKETGYWTYYSDGCDTSEPGADNGYVRCALSQPYDGFWWGDGLDAQSPVYILD